jgi:hypothetical protein
MSRKPDRIIRSVDSESRRLARGVFGFSRSRGIALLDQAAIHRVRRLAGVVLAGDQGDKAFIDHPLDVPLMSGPIMVPSADCAIAIRGLYHL